MRPDRPVYDGHRYATRELLYANECAGSSGFDRDEARRRVAPLLERGDVDTYLRVDFSSDFGRSLPAEPAEIDCFVNFMREVAADPILGAVTGYIIGNETNIEGRTPLEVVRIIYGTPGDTNNVYDAVREVNVNSLVLLPAVGPWNEAADGDLANCTADDESGCSFPRDRTRLTRWERYLYSVAYRAYHTSNAPDDQITFALHVYSRLDKALALNLPKNAEPNVGIRDIDLDANGNGTGAYVNSWVYDDFRHQITAARGNGLVPWHIIGEWNTVWDYNNDGELTADEMPSGRPAGQEEGIGAYAHGLFGNLITEYLRHRDQLLAVINFVDQHVGGDRWDRTAMCHTPECALDATQRERLETWQGDFDFRMREGW